MNFALDEHGNLVLLAVEVPSKSGNPSHGFRGQFAPRIAGKRSDADPDTPERRSGRPSDIPPAEWGRREDAVRDAAREMDDMEEADAKEFLTGRVKDMAKVDLQQFLVDVRSRRLDDLVDALDSSLRRQSAPMKRGRRTVRVVAPRGWSRKTTAGLDHPEIQMLVARLRSRGWSQGDLKKYLVPRFSGETKKAAESWLS